MEVFVTTAFKIDFQGNLYLETNCGKGTNLDLSQEKQ